MTILRIETEPQVLRDCLQHKNLHRFSIYVKYVVCMLFFVVLILYEVQLVSG